jgi:hypothetical protein
MTTTTDQHIGAFAEWLTTTTDHLVEQARSQGLTEEQTVTAVRAELRRFFASQTA